MDSRAEELLKAFGRALEASSGPNGDGRMRLIVTFNAGDELAAIAAVSRLIADGADDEAPLTPEWRREVFAQGLG